MKKEFIKNWGLAIDAILYSIVFVMGYVLLVVSDNSISSLMPIYVYSAFYIFSFIILIVYFVSNNEKKNSYLMFSFLNIILASAVMISCKDTEMFYKQFSEVVVFYTIFIAMVDFLELKRLNKIKMIVKTAVMLASIIIGVVLALIIYDTRYLSLYIMSYYFIALGLFKIIECLLYVLVDGPTFQEKVNKNKKVVKEEKTKLKELKKRKPRARK